MSKRIGIIGFGNMGGAIAFGALTTPALRGAFSVNAHDLNESRKESLEKAGGRWFTSPLRLAEESDYVLLAVKPYQVAAVISELVPALDKNKTLLSIAAGQPLTALRTYLGGVCPAVQVMPNTPAVIGAGAFALCFDDPTLPPERKQDMETLFKALGAVFVLPEAKMNAFTAVAGCGPAYVYAMMDAVIEGAVTLGFTRAEATAMTVSLFKGSARMVEEMAEPPATLHGHVTSPGGATIAGTNHLARTAVRGHIIDAILAAYARGKEMESE